MTKSAELPCALWHVILDANPDAPPLFYLCFLQINCLRQVTRLILPFGDTRTLMRRGAALQAVPDTLPRAAEMLGESDENRRNDARSCATSLFPRV